MPGVRLHRVKERLRGTPRRARLFRRAEAVLLPLASLALASGGLYAVLQGGGIGHWAAFLGFGLCAVVYFWNALYEFGLVTPRRARSPSHTVTVTGDGVSCRSPRGETESVSWSALQAVAIEAVDAVPVGNLYWRLVGDDGTGCAVPVEAAGSGELLESLQRRLPGFKNEVVIAAMAMTDGVAYVWHRDWAGDEPD